MRLASRMAAALLLLPPAVYAGQAVNPRDARTVVAGARQRVESTDARASGHLVRVDGTGKRTSNAITLKAHWFPGVLRVLLEFSPSKAPGADATSGATPASGLDTRLETHNDARLGILLEMRPGGQSTVQVFHPHGAAPTPLPFDRWNEGVLGSDFAYEDFLQPELYWPGQTILKTARLGARTCDVLKSTPGASDRTHYAEVQTWLDQTIGYPIFAEKTLKNGAVVKDFTSFGLTQSGGGWSARQVEAKVQGRAGSTLLIFDRGSTKAHLTMRDFSPASVTHADDQP